MIAYGPGWELRLGRWENTLGDSWGAVLITDPPFSPRTHKGHNAGVESTRLKRAEGRTRIDKRDGSVYSVGKNRRRKLSFEAWTAEDVEKLIIRGPAIRGWRVILTDHQMVPWWETSFQRKSLYSFPPLPYVAPGSRVRLAGDGPSCWTVPIVVARPRNREFSRWGTLPGAYILPRAEKLLIAGAKPLWLMRQLVRHYSKPGDLVIDPCAGSGTTLLAAVIENRRALGAERDPHTFDIARKRLMRGYTPAMEGICHRYS